MTRFLQLIAACAGFGVGGNFVEYSFPGSTVTQMTGGAVLGAIIGIMAVDGIRWTYRRLRGAR